MSADAISTRIPPKGSRPGIDVIIECRDPTATGLQDFIPTLVEASMELPLDGTHQDAPNGGFDLLAGKPVIARARFARSVAEPETRITIVSLAAMMKDNNKPTIRPRCIIEAPSVATLPNATDENHYCLLRLDPQDRRLSRQNKPYRRMPLSPAIGIS